MDEGTKTEIQAVTHQMFESDSVGAMLHPKAHMSLKLDDQWRSGNLTKEYQIIGKLLSFEKSAQNW